MTIRPFAIAALICFSFMGKISTQTPAKPTSAELFAAIQKLQVLGSVLFVAAHPDDENTRLISYLANEQKVNIAYLSLTRGDGGQNLIGPETEELLGVIRTQELLAARRIDGGKQLFTRANDFGFSKNPDETLTFWSKNEVLSDVVWAIRKWQPDVVINRFDHNSAGKTHGHHTASAMLGVEAFDLAADRRAFPEQLGFVQTWTPRRLFFNTSWWFYGSQEAFDKADKSNMVQMDVGVFFPEKGKSNNEIAAESRSQHRCQAMGTLGSRGSQMEYLQLLKGDMPADKNKLLDGINTTWSRVAGGVKIGKLLQAVERGYDHSKPWLSVPKLLEAYRMMKNLPEGYWRTVKVAEIELLLRGCMGIFAEAIASDNSATAGEEVDLRLECIVRAPISVRLEKVQYLPMRADSTLHLDLKNNVVAIFTKKLRLPDDMPLTNAYWLNERWHSGMYTVSDQLLRGLPETPRQFKVRWHLSVNGEALAFDTDVAHKKEISDRGEIYYPFEVTPPVFVRFANKAIVLPTDAPKSISLKLKAGKAALAGKVSISAPAVWRIEPQAQPFSLGKKGEETTVSFTIHPPDQPTESWVEPIVQVGNQKYQQELVTIQYDHIPQQTVLLPSQAKLTHFDLQSHGQRIGYVMGAGDDIPTSLQQLGYQVTLLSEEDLRQEVLERFDAVITGVRAYNTREKLQFAQPVLFEYAKNGGTLVMQYNTSFDLVTTELAPYKLKLGRDRVSVEDAEVRLLMPDHPVLNEPNKISTADFNGWVQERGLYFASEWGPEFDAVLSCNDPGESPKNSGLLVAKYGKGYFVHTSFSWFRQLPVGVTGAYRLFANVLSLGKRDQP
jgi:LmbE family N-acetylglucosaminyl deacetylase